MTHWCKLGASQCLLVGLSVMLLTSCATSPTGRTQFIIISPDAAIIESEAAYLGTVQQLDDEDKLVDDSLTVARVARITGRLVSIAAARFPDSADWNAILAATVREGIRLNCWKIKATSVLRN